MIRQGFVEWCEDPEHGFWIRDSYDTETGNPIGPGKLRLFDFQKRILSKVLTPDPETGLFPYTTIIYSCPKKSGKTKIAAAVAAWYAECADSGTEVYLIANDQEQAEGLVMKDIIHHAKEVGYKAMKGEVQLPDGTFIKALSQSYRSIAGTRHGLTIWDELWGYNSEAARRAWDEMTPIPTIQQSLRFISTYAGFESQSDLLKELYLQGVGTDENELGMGHPVPGLEDLPCYANGRLFVYWDHEPRMPWQTDEYYEDQRKSLRPSAYVRLHTNNWVTSNEEFIPMEWWDRACKVFTGPADGWLGHPYYNFPVSIGVDAAIKRDCTAIVGCTHDSKRGKTILLFHKIWTPKSGEWFDLEATVESYLIEQFRKFRVISILCDPAHLHQTLTRLKFRGLPVVEYTQTVTNMVRASQSLYDTLKYNNLEAYPDEELKRHIQLALAETTSTGFRIVKNKSNKSAHMDGAIATALAVYDSIQHAGIDSGNVLSVVNPFSKMGRDRTAPDQFQFPPELRE